VLAAAVSFRSLKADALSLDDGFPFGAVALDGLFLSSMLPPSGWKPSATSFAANSGLFTILLVSRLRRSTISCGVPAGAPMPNQLSAR